ncbi:MAG: sulfotransferase family protein [Solirubrobacterales bacterium]
MPTQGSPGRGAVPLVEVEAVSLHREHAQAYGLSIGQPTPETRSHDSYSFPLDGRVGDARSLLGVDLFHAGTRLNRIWHRRPRSTGGDDGSVSFSWPVNALAMPPSFDAEVRAVLDDRTHASLATITGRRARIDSACEPTIQPLLITSLGRSGSTVLMRALEQHPEIAACPAFEYESTVSLYWLAVLRDLSQPASYRHQLVNQPGTRLGGPEWWRASQGPLPPALSDTRLEQIVGRNAVGRLATFCHSQIDLVYRQLADRFGRPGATYFAEKTIPAPLLSLLDELYPDGREIVLIRDFRDHLCSVVDFYSRRGLLDVRRDRDRVLELAGDARKSAMALLARCRLGEGRVHVLRYEDMVLAPTETFSALLAYLSLPEEPAVLVGMTDAVTRPDATTASHRTVADAAASVGRWQRDLQPDVVEAAGEELRVPLESFGYS